MRASTRGALAAVAVGLCLTTAVNTLGVSAQDDAPFRAHLLRLVRAQATAQQAQQSASLSWSAVTRALAEGQPDSRLQSLAGTWLQSRQEEARAAREVVEAESLVTAALFAGKGGAPP